jgi:DNA-directed RNA polymerase specialized sigma24 family protein
MDLRGLNLKKETPEARTEELLVAHYEKFFQWALALARGDEGKAEELVQEFCLYLVLTKPDLRHVANLDGYLYVSLRNLYQSGLARSAREAARVVHVAEFDSLGIALADKQRGDTLDRQNDLRRICHYSVWRKDQSKNFCYFVLHFFHGYSRSEVAEMSGASLAAIYNKLHSARTEIRAYLEGSGKLRILGKDEPPQPVLLWNRLPEPEFFRELRKVILRARRSPCLPEQELLATYRASWMKPLSCELLSHLASCERCLNLVDGNFRRPTLRDRDPLDSTESQQGAEPRQMPASKRSAAHRLQALRTRIRETYEHRPRTLCIAVNGRIVALHDVQGARSILAARIDSPEKASFVEVFSEQDFRLALLSISAEPPQGAQTMTQRVLLSDERWLELNLAFDGLGLSSEVTYYDPVLGMVAEAGDTEESEESVSPEASVLPATPSDQVKPDMTGRGLADWLRKLIPSPAFAWALMLLAVFSTAGYFVYRHANAPLTAEQVLDRSIKLEAARLQGKTVHQTLRVEEVSASGQIAQKGTIEVLKDGDGSRFLRRFYDAQHHLMAADWRVDKKSHHSYQRKYGSELARVPWTQDLSADAFGKLSQHAPLVRRNEESYVLTVKGPMPEQPHLVEATLVLTRRFVPVREDFQLRNGKRDYRVRFVQLSVSYTRSGEVPNKAFEPASVPDNSESSTSSLTRGGSAEQLASLDIAVLYQLSEMDADTGIPIEVRRTPDGHLRVLGSIGDPALRNRVVDRLHALPNHQLLDINLAAANSAGWSGLQSLHASSGPLHVYQAGGTTPPADALIRARFTKQGLSGKQLDKSVSEFSSGVLVLSQHALQNAYALDRLGKAISISGANTLDTHSLEQWTEMVRKHASLLETELRSLHAELNDIAPSQQRASELAEPSMTIENTDEFAEASGTLLHQAQQVNQSMNWIFASQGMGEKNQNVAARIISTKRMLPILEASEINALAKRLSREDADIPSEKADSSGTGHKIQR